MKIASIQKVSFIDYPDKIGAVLFCPYCNLRCPYCHNPELVFFTGQLVDEESIFSYLKSRVGILEGVVITGGEPTLQKDLRDFIIKIKDMGFSVKLDTNGHNPKVLNTVIDIVDMIAIDIKTSCQKYKTIGGNCVILKESLNLLKDFKGDLILRTTLYPPMTTKDDLEEMKSFIPDDLKYSDWMYNEYRDIKTLEKYIKEHNEVSGEGALYTRF
jgi:pyruvate formate lyase activating enzyme